MYLRSQSIASDANANAPLPNPREKRNTFTHFFSRGSCCKAHFPQITMVTAALVLKPDWIRKETEIPKEFAKELSHKKTLISEYLIGNVKKPRSRLRISVSPSMLVRTLMLSLHPFLPSMPMVLQPMLHTCILSHLLSIMGEHLLFPSASFS